MRYSQLFVQAAMKADDNPEQAELLIREAEKHSSPYFPADLILCAKTWGRYLKNADQAQRCLLKAEVQTSDCESYLELADAYLDILNDVDSAQRCCRKAATLTEDGNRVSEWIEANKTKLLL